MLGMPTLIEFNSLEENFILCKSLQLDFIELNLNLPMYQNLNVEEVKGLMKKYGISLTMHASERINPFDLDPYFRQSSLASLRHTFKLANELHVSIVNMHLDKGIYFTLPTQKIHLYSKFEDEYLNNIKGLFHLIEEYPDVLLLIENTGILNYDYINKMLLKLIEHPQIYMTYDIGHDITSGFNDRMFYQKHHDMIRHYHIHDGNDQSNHLPLFTGELDIAEYLKIVKQNKLTAVIEVKSKEQLIESINSIKRRGIR